jgi:hypothetical protein
MWSGELDKWYPYKMPCSEWLVAMVYWHMVNGGFRFGGVKESRKNLRRRLAARWPHILTNPEDHATFYGRNGQLLCWCGDRGKRGGCLYAAGRTKEDFRKIDKAFKVDWSYSDLDDE